MRMAALFIATLGVLAGPALAQATPGQAVRPAASHRKPAHHAYSQSYLQSRSHRGNSPVDVGPFTPEANRAYQGGGVVLQGEPGAPAPTPQATPRGQMPLNSVPPKQ